MDTFDPASGLEDLLGPSLADAALDHARRGRHVFFVAAGRKAPPPPQWQRIATRDEATVRRWWTEQPQANIAWAPGRSGHLVLDVDTKSAGPASLAQLEQQHGALPETLTIRTPSGGRHFVFEGSAPSSVGRVGRGLDIRSSDGEQGHGYALLPPSSVNGHFYVVERDAPIAAAPQWLLDAAAATTAIAVRAASADLDAPASIARARALLADLVKRGDVAIEFHGGNDRTYRLACELLNLGLSPEMAFDLLDEIWNPACQPPWSGAELEQILEHATRYAQNEPGAWAVPPAKDAFGETVGRLELTNKQQQSDSNVEARSPFRLLKRGEYRNLPPQRWLLDKLLPEVGVVLGVGHSQALKSFVMLDVAASIASQAQVFGSLPPSLSGAVVYVAGEGQYGIKAQRVPAWEKERGIRLDDCPFYVVENMPLAQDEQAISDLTTEIEKAVGAERVRLIVLDTLAHMSGSLKENDSELKLCGIVAVRLSRRFSCCVVIIHHPPKSEDGEKANPRGSKANYEIADTVIGFFRQEDTTDILTKLVVDKQKDGERGYTLWLGAKVAGLGRNEAGQPVSSLVLHVLEEGAIGALKASTDDRLAWAETALKGLAARGEMTVTGGRLARAMHGMKDPTVPQNGAAGTPDQEREIANLLRKLTREAGGDRWRHLVKKAGSSRSAPWMWSLPSVTTTEPGK